MRVTIIRDDGVVGVGGKFKTIDVSSLPAGVRAVQWDGVSGHVEYDDGPNAQLDSLEAYQSFVDLWNAPDPVITPAPGFVPTTISMRQAQQALLKAGYWDQVATLIANMPGEAGKAARIDWNTSREISRTYPLVAAMAAAIPLTSSQLDDLFTLAASL